MSVYGRDVATINPAIHTILMRLIHLLADMILGELRSKETRLQTKLEGCGRQQSERADLAVKVFELSQLLARRWFAADIAEKRLLLEIICLN